ncbi:FecR family protein [Sphingobacterium faecale]|uniref:FecR domain-containing protein n=1 Tax=Sphingobacterium faecale TaxID=2803775 RepID=A0ABS1RB08_9SPHI|nr:FecR domain-containing protein [Sphingobacterium faecale]MBL1411202.1 FecR domain-containing protein [Sphingobacterium faecale]
MRQEDRFELLLQSYLADELSVEEIDEFFTYVEETSYQLRLQAAIDASFLQPDSNGPSLSVNRLRSIENQILGRTTRRLPSLSWRIAAACIILALSGLTVWKVFFTSTALNDPYEVVYQRGEQITAPSDQQAYITLADGRSVILDSLSIDPSLGSDLRRTAEGVRYDVSEEGLNPITYNTLTNPRGSKIVQLVLSDGTKVWLNAGSSLRYPTRFALGDRSVYLEGEGYFDVQHDQKRPFFVKHSTLEVQVLGTQFNMSVYKDDSQHKVALLEGSVKLQATHAQGQGHISPVLLSPGTAASIRRGDQKFALSQVSLGQIGAWKDGRFDFEGVELKDAMRQIARWYDIDVHYEGTLPQLVLSGDIDRTTSLKSFLMILRSLGLSLRFENRVLTIYNENQS